jgi:nucleotide-binding universal stress UspA family protein
MALKDILVYVDDAKACPARLAVATALAQQHDAHLTGLTIVSPPPIPAYVQANLPREALEVQRRHTRAKADRAKQNFDEAIAATGREARAEWREAHGDGRRDQVAEMHARYADLAIVGQADPDDERPESDFLAETLMFGAGRPILVVPYIGATAGVVGERAIVAWDAGREATRAVNDALPILEVAKWVEVLVVNPSPGLGGHGEEPGADIALHLSRHNVKATSEHLVAEDIDVADTILSRCADQSADLLVMGAYGHSRLREMVLGGATRHILRHMTVPVLMSH